MKVFLASFEGGPLDGHEIPLDRPRETIVPIPYGQTLWPGMEAGSYWLDSALDLGFTDDRLAATMSYTIEAPSLARYVWHPR